MTKRGSGRLIARGLNVGNPGPAGGRLKCVNSLEDIEEVRGGDIVLIPRDAYEGDNLLPFYRCIKGGAVGILTERGGKADHGAVAAKELGIPCIVNFDASVDLSSLEGEDVVIRGGEMYRGVEDLSLETPERKMGKTPETRAKVRINLGFPEVIDMHPKLLDLADGVGFMRLEFVMLDILDNEHPLQYVDRMGQEALAEHLSRRIKPVVREFGERGKTVWIRTDDFSTSQLMQMRGGEAFEVEEQNPMLGWRGIRRSIDEPRFIHPQFQALRFLVDEGHHNMGVFPPMTRVIDEYLAWRGIAEDLGLRDVDYGLMVETPSSALTFEDFVGHVDFMIFGSNDLIQFTLAIDRSNVRLQDLFDERRKAVLKLMEMVINHCRENNIESCIGGQGGSNPDLMRTLLGFGISGTSVNPDIETVAMMRDCIAAFESA
ncbi:MAG: putative PEP-binding protein [Candidatus Geothermarchaeales archaeon]